MYSIGNLMLLSIAQQKVTCDTLVSVNFAPKFDSLQFILQDEVIRLTDVLGSCWLG